MGTELAEEVKKFYADICETLSLVSEINYDQLQPRHRAIVEQLHEDVMKRYYGSGFLIPELIDGANVLDVGCGCGSLCFLLSKLVGVKGRVTGVDLTPELITEAERHVDYHRDKWGYTQSNITFRVGNIENYEDIGLPENSQDVVVSNGVLCLCPNMRKVYENVYKVLKDGGEFCLSDVYADRDRPSNLKDDYKLFSFGTTGSLRWDEMGVMPVDVGFTKPYLVSVGSIAFENDELCSTLGHTEYVCAEWRLFKLPPGARRPAAEVTYNGYIEGIEDAFKWDINIVFKKGEPVAVDSDLASILAFSRYKNSFTFKDTESSVVTNTIQNPFAHLDDLRQHGQKLTPVYTIYG